MGGNLGSLYCKTKRSEMILRDAVIFVKISRFFFPEGGLFGKNTILEVLKALCHEVQKQRTGSNFMRGETNFS